MAVLCFKVEADYEKVIKLREEISKLENQLKSFGKSTPEMKIHAVEMQLGSARKEFAEITTEAAKAGAIIEHDFKKKIFDASSSVNELTEKIIAQKAVIKDVEHDVKSLGEAYRTKLKSNPMGADGALAEYKAAKRALDEEKVALFGLSQQQAEARLSVKKLRDEYAIFKKDAGESTDVIDSIKDSMAGWGKKIFAGWGIKEIIGQMVQVRGEFQATDTAIRTLLGSEEKANALTSQIREYAKVSPLEFSDVTKATQMMLGFNIEAEKVPKFISAIGDVSMGESQKFNSLTLAFSQMSAAGKLTGQDLNQMINAGFNPLQVMADKTGKSMSDLKKEMSKGAISAEMVQQAFVDATSAGGKFYQMSENASKTINGQLSMLQDSMDSVFNELGKSSESTIVNGIQLTTSLINNYEKIGRIITGLVAVYGTYRAGLLVTLAVEQARNKTLWANITATKAYTVAQAALNAVMKVNPYVLLATAVTGLVAAVWAFRDSTSAAEKEAARLKEREEDDKKAIEDRRDAIDKAISSIQDETKSDKERRDALVSLRNLMPSVFSKYKTEKQLIDDITNAKKASNAELERELELKGKKNFKEDENQLKLLEDFIKLSKNKKVVSAANNQISSVGIEGEVRRYTDARNYVSSNKEFLSGGGFINVDAVLAKIKALRTTVQKETQQMREAAATSWDTELLKKNVEEIKKGITFDENAIKEAVESGKKYIQLAGDVYPTSVEELKRRVRAAREQIKLINENAGKDFLKDAEKAWKSAEKKVKDIIKNRGDRSLYPTEEAYRKALEKAKADEKSAKSKFEGLGGQTKGKTEEQKQSEIASVQSKLGDLLNKQGISRKRAIEDLLNDEEQSRIDTLEEGYEKELAQMKLNQAKRIQELKREKEELIQKNRDDAKAVFDAQEEVKAKQNSKYAKKQFDASGIGLTDEQKAIYDQRVAYAKEVNRKETEDFNKKQIQSMNEYLKEYGTYQEKRKAITDIANEKIRKASTKGERMYIATQMRKELSELDINANKTTAAISKLFSDMSNKAVKDMRKIADAGEEALQFLISGEWDSAKGIEFGMTKETFEILRKSPEELDKIKKAIERIRKGADDADRPLKKMLAGFKQMAASEGELNRFQEGFAKVKSEINKVTQSVGFLTDSISELAEANGGEFGGVLETASGIFDKTMQGAELGSKFGGYGAIIGGAAGFLTSLGTAMAKSADKDSEERIEDLQEQVDKLDKSYSKLGKSIEDAFSADASALIEQQNTLLMQKKALIQQQMMEEQNKKDSDQDRIKEYQEQIDEIDELIEDNKRKAVDAIFGEDIKSAIENFADAYADAWANSENRTESARDQVKRMMKQMVTESIKAAIQASGKMEEIRETLKNFFADSVLSDWEQDYVVNLAENLQKDLDMQFKWADELMKGDDGLESQKASNGSFQTMSQDVGTALEGRFAAVQVAAEGSRSSLERSELSLLQLNNTLLQVYLSEQESQCIADDIRNIIAQSYLELVGIRENTEAVIKPIKSMSEKISKWDTKIMNM